MIRTGDKVAFRGGNTQYEAIMADVAFTGRTYTLISTKTGRKRYKVQEHDLTPWAQRTPVKAVRTSRGRVARPKSWKTLPSFAGGARRTYIGEDWVFKKGHSDWGDSRCMVEAARYAMQSGKMTLEDVRAKYGASVAGEMEYYSTVPVAECYLLEDGTLLMERVLPIRSLQYRDGAPSMTTEERNAKGFGYGGKNTPDWAGRVDSEQIGFNRKGELVAYDL